MDFRSRVSWIVFSAICFLNSCEREEGHDLGKGKNIPSNHETERDKLLSRIRENAEFALVEIGPSGFQKIILTSSSDGVLSGIPVFSSTVELFDSEGASHILVLQHGEIDFRKVTGNVSIDTLAVYDGKVTIYSGRDKFVYRVEEITSP